MRLASLTTTLVSAAIAVTALAPASAQEAQRKPTPYADLAKLPDWSGVWQPDWSSLFPRTAQQPPQFTPAAAKTAADYVAAQADGRNTQNAAANCVPPGMPQIMRMPYPIEFIFSPDRVTLITETEGQVRRIYTDGRPLPDDPDPAFNGWSIGHWEGKVFVAETIGLNPKNSIVPGIKATEQTKIVERIWSEKPDLIVIETTVTDPGLFAQPYVTKQAYARQADWQIREYVCAENNKDGADAEGRPSMDLEFGPTD